MFATQHGLPCTSQHILRHMNSNWNRAPLPVNQHYEEILQCVADNDITIIVGSTGCGKTTRVPQFILHHQLLPQSQEPKTPVAHHHIKALVQHDHKIIITQPRRIATINAAARISYETGSLETDMVAYEIGMDKQATQQTRIVVCTTGVLVQRIVNQGGEALDQYNYIIIDEVHEREQDMDLVLLLVRERLRDLLAKIQQHYGNSIEQCANEAEKAALLRQYMQLRAPKVILMSATIDVARLKAYFSETIAGGLSVGIVSIVQRLRDVEEYFLGEWTNMLLTSGGGGDTLTQQLMAEKTTAGASSLPAGANTAEFQQGRRPVFNVALVEHLCTLITVLDVVEKQKFSRGPPNSADVDDSNEEGDAGSPAAAALAASQGVDGLLSIGRGTVLVFLPGYEEISRVRVALERMARTHNLEVMFMHSSVSADDQRRAVSESAIDGTDMRRVILCTNICESSLTVPKVRFVFDFCMQKVMEWDSDTLMSSLNLRYASKAACSQRKGRTGRDCDGCVYRLISREAYEQLPLENEADMRIGPLHNTILRLKTFVDRESYLTHRDVTSSLSVFALLGKCLDGPSRPVYDLQLQQLREIGALTNPYRMASPAAASGFKLGSDADSMNVRAADRPKNSSTTPPKIPKIGISTSKTQVTPTLVNVSPEHAIPDRNPVTDRIDCLIIDDGDSEGLLTPLGEFISGLPIELEAAKCLMYSCMFGCLNDGIIAAAALTTPSVFEVGFNKDRPIETVAKKSIWIGLQDDRSDLLATCNAFKCWSSFHDVGERRAFADAYGLRHGRLENLQRTCNELTNLCSEKGLLDLWNTCYTSNDFEDGDDADDAELSLSRGADEIEKQFLLSIAVASALYPSYYMLMPLSDEQRIRFAQFASAGIVGSDVYRTFCISVRVPSIGVAPISRQADVEQIERVLKSYLANGLLDGINFSLTHLPTESNNIQNNTRMSTTAGINGAVSRLSLAASNAAGSVTTWFVKLGAREATLASIKDRVHPFMYRIMSSETSQKFNVSVDADEHNPHSDDKARGAADGHDNDREHTKSDNPNVLLSPTAPPVSMPIKQPPHITNFEWCAMKKSIRTFKIAAYGITDIPQRSALLRKEFGEYADIMGPMLLWPESENQYQNSTSSSMESSSSSVSKLSDESRVSQTSAPNTKSSTNNSQPTTNMTTASQKRHYTKIFADNPNILISEDFWANNNVSRKSSMLKIPVGEQNTTENAHMLHDCFVMHFATSAEFYVLPARLVPIHQLMRLAVDRLVVRLQTLSKAEQHQQLMPFEVDEAVIALNPAFRKQVNNSLPFMPNLVRADEVNSSHFEHRSSWARGIFLGYDIELQLQQQDQPNDFIVGADNASEKSDGVSKSATTGTAAFVFFIDSGNYARVSIVKGHIFHMPMKIDLDDCDAVLFSKPLAQRCVFAQRSQAVFLHEHQVVDRVEQYLLRYPGLFRVTVENNDADVEAVKPHGFPAVWKVRKLFAVVNVRENAGTSSTDADSDVSEVLLDLTSSLERAFGWSTASPTAAVSSITAKKPSTRTLVAGKGETSAAKWPAANSAANLIQNLLDASSAASGAVENPNVIELECQIEPHPLVCTSVRSVREDFAAAGVVMQSTSLNNVQFHQQPQALSQVLIGFQAQKPRKNNNIMLRETHMLPPVPGMLGLLGLCLAPDVQLVSFGTTGKFVPDSIGVTECVKASALSLPQRWPTVHDVVGLICSLNVSPANVQRLLSGPLPANNTLSNSRLQKISDETTNAGSSSNSEVPEDDNDVLWNDSAAGIEAMLRKKLLYMPLDIHLCREDLTDANEIRKIMSEIALNLNDRPFILNGRLSRLQQRLRRKVVTLFTRSHHLQTNFMPYADLRKEAVSSLPAELLHFNVPKVLSEYYEQDKLDGPELIDWVWRKPICMPEQCDWRDAVDASLQRKIEGVTALEHEAKIAGKDTRDSKRASADDDGSLTYFHYCALCAQAVSGDEGVAKHVEGKGHVQEVQNLLGHYTQ